jgi:CheY-like chemotaxis protein
VLVSDIGMPDEDGYELLRRVRASETPGHTVKAVALTAYTSVEHRRRALEAGFHEHVAKPVDIGRIVELVSRLVAPRPGGQ